VKGRLPKPPSLRRRSELRLKEAQTGGNVPAIGNDTQRLFHELQVHQIELELQNEELNHANNVANAALEKYTDLYDFAPVGYFTLDSQGQIEEFNMAGAVLLGVERSRLVGGRIQLFVDLKSRPTFQEFLGRIFSDSGRQECEAKLASGSHGTVWVEIAGISQPVVAGSKRLSRIVVSDISARKLAEEQHQRIGILAATNRNLQREILDRRIAEAALKKSEERFRLLLSQSRVLEERLRKMAREMLKVQEDERRKISRELHDEVSQILLSINVQLTLFAKASATDPRGVRKAIGPMRRAVEKAVSIVHRFARELRPAMLDDLGLIPTLRSYIEDLPKKRGRVIRLKADTRVEVLENDIRTVLYRIAQEALTNAIKHSRASIVDISVLKTEASAALEVSDNGISFDVTRIASNEWQDCLGLTGMRERVEMVGGRFAVVSTPGIGTIVRAEIPFHSHLRKARRPVAQNPKEA
jgi:PAS domain S-box-containing protein